MGSWMKRIQLLVLVFPPRASSQLFLPPSSNLLPVIEPLSDPFVDVFEFGGVDQDHVDQDHVDQDHVDQDHVDQDHVDQDHVDQDHVDQGLLRDEQSITFPTTSLDGYRCANIIFFVYCIHQNQISDGNYQLVPKSHSFVSSSRLDCVDDQPG